MASQDVGLNFLKNNEITNKTCNLNKPFAFFSYSHNAHDAQIVRGLF